MIVAAVGLLQSSTAVVIGAMLIAPLMAPIIGITVDLRWIPVSESDPRKPDAPVALDRIRPIAEQWLAAQSLTPDGLSYDQNALVVSTSGAQPPADTSGPVEIIEARTGTRIMINTAWTRKNPADLAQSNATAVTAARATVAAWAKTHPDTIALAIDQTGDTLVVTLLSSISPTSPN